MSQPLPTHEVWRRLEEELERRLPPSHRFGTNTVIVRGRIVGRVPGPQRYEPSVMERLQVLRLALDESVGLAAETLRHRLAGITLEAVLGILLKLVKDVALYWGGAVVAGAAIGGAIGFFAGGVGAVPGAAIGAAAGNVAGQWLLGLLGLKPFAEGLWHTLPPALNRYESGFKKAWDAARSPHASSWSAQHFAAHDFAEGHVLLLCAVLMLLVAYLARNGVAGRAQALADIAKSPRLGPRIAQWLDEHEAALAKHPALQAKPKAQAAAPRQEVAAVQRWQRVDDRFPGSETSLSSGKPTAPQSVGNVRSNLLQVRTSTEMNQAMVERGDLGAWGGDTVATETVPAGTRYNMVVSRGQAQALADGKPAFGAWATADNVPSQAFARNELSILPEFKQDVSFVVQVETTAPQTVNRGLVGSLGGYAGGASQVEFVGERNLKLVGSPQPLPAGPR